MCREAAQARAKKSGRVAVDVFGLEVLSHPAGNPGANLKSISHRYYLREEEELTEETIDLPLLCLQGGGG